jgi:hypothetical protein
VSSKTKTHRHQTAQHCNSGDRDEVVSDAVPTDECLDEESTVLNEWKWRSTLRNTISAVAKKA